MSETPNMADLFGRMAEMQQKMADTQSMLEVERVTAEAGGGMVAVTANGAGRIVSIKIEPDAVDPSDIELLEDLVMAGVNKAIEETEALKARKMQDAATSMLPPGLDLGGMGLPGM
ncbi:MAG: YbaB/EbfC family nucleoid-associated protein [Rubricoccaceae bacterium]